MVGETSRSRFPRSARACPSPSSGQSNTRGGQAPALRFARPPSFTVGRGPVPRRAWVGRETALVGVWFSRGSSDRGGQAPALRFARLLPFTVGLGPSDATRACERVSLAIVRARAIQPTSVVCDRLITNGSRSLGIYARASGDLALQG